MVILLSPACAALAQLQEVFITFGNNLPELKAPIYETEIDWALGGDWAYAKTGNTASGMPPGGQVYHGGLLSSWVVSFWAWPGVVNNGYSMFRSPTTTTLGTGSLAGYFPTTTASFLFPFIPPNGVATVQVRVHDPSGLWAFGGYDGDGAVAAVSALLTVNIGGTATGLRSFSAGWLDPATGAPYAHVPEPSSISLLFLGGALFLHRLRKSRS
jgi:hypothetical protein